MFFGLERRNGLPRSSQFRDLSKTVRANGRSRHLSNIFASIYFEEMNSGKILITNIFFYVWISAVQNGTDLLVLWNEILH
jgi:hypothetical protein